MTQSPREPQLNERGLPRRIAIIGAGHLGQQLAAHLEDDSRMSFAGFVDDCLSGDGTRVIGRVTDARGLFMAGRFDLLLMAIGYRHLTERARIFESLQAEVPFATFIHRTAWIDPTAKVGPGCIVYPAAVVDQRAVLEANVLLNLNVTVSHDSVIGAHSFVAPSVSIAGFGRVGHGCVLGIGTTMVDGISLSPHVRSGAGTVFVRDASAPGLYVGVPARRVKD